MKESEDMRPRFKLGWARQGASMEANVGACNSMLAGMEANMGAEMGEKEAIKSKEVSAALVLDVDHGCSDLRCCLIFSLLGLLSCILKECII